MHAPLSSPQDIDRLLRRLAEEDEKRWESQPAPKMLEDGSPSLARMYTAVLHEDMTDEERAFLDDPAHPKARRAWAKVQSGVWHPDPATLLFWHWGFTAMFTEDMMTDIDYHMYGDECRRCRRIVGIEAE